MSGRSAVTTSWPPILMQKSFLVSFPELEPAVGRLHHQSHKATRLSEVSWLLCKSKCSCCRWEAPPDVSRAALLMTLRKGCATCTTFFITQINSARLFSHTNCSEIPFVSIVERHKSHPRFCRHRHFVHITDFNAVHDVLWWLLTFIPRPALPRP